MAKKRVEEQTKETVDIMSSFEVDTTPEEPVKTVIPKNVREVPERTIRHETYHNSDEPVNCLRNERIIVRFVPRPTSMVQNPKHVLYGGMAESATRSFVVPRLNSTGMFKNVLTDSEKNFLEKAMGLEYNALSIYKRKDNFWDDSNPLGIGRVTLHKQDNYLDLSVPEDHIKYKILLANKDYIASSLQELEDRPKATYQFVIISETAESQMNTGKMNATMKCYMEYGKIENDFDTLRVVIELLEGRPTSPNVKLDYLQNKVNDYIQSNPRRFLSTVKDDLLPAKVLIKKCVESGLIGKKNDAYYLRQDGTPLCEMNEESTLNNAAKYISSVKRQDLKYTLEAKLKDK
jgi:hypothetical protein